MWGAEAAPEATEEEVDENMLTALFENKLTCNFVKVLIENARTWKIKSITVSGYNPAIEKGIRFQDVTFSDYDLCVTNPPFSLYSDFMNCILGEVDFICLAPFLNRVTPNLGLPLMRKNIFLGYGRHQNILFHNPEKDDSAKRTLVACDWITSFNDAQEQVNKNYVGTGIKFDDYKDKYITMTGMTMKDNTHPIRVPANLISDDYDGWMFSSVNVLDTISTDKYVWYGTNYMKFYNSTHPEESPFKHKTTNEMLKVGDKQLFHGIIFKKVVDK